MIETLRAALKGIDRAKLEALVEPIARAHGAEVVDMEFKPDQGGWALRVFVEKLGSAEQQLSTELSAIDLEVCSNIARELSPALDVADLVPHAYNLEIGSPGVERTLRGSADFVRFKGKKAKLKLHEGVGANDSTVKVAQKIILGILADVTPTHVSLSDGPTMHSVPLSDVSSARLVFEFGPAPKPGKTGKDPSKSNAPVERSKRSV
jgi:ribosome maturation factor RimP